MKKFKDRVGTIWRSIGDNKLSCDPNQDSNTRYCPTREMVEFVYGPLTDVTEALPTGEPLPKQCDECESRGRNCLAHKDTPRKPEPGDRVRAKTPNGNSFEGMYVTEYRAGKDQVSVVEDDCILTVTGHPEDLVWEVIEPARPAVPEDPERDVFVAVRNGNGSGDQLARYDRSTRLYEIYGDIARPWAEIWNYAAQNDYVIVEVRYERGPVIGGSDE